MKKVLMHCCCAPCFITIQEDISQNGMLINGQRVPVEMTAFWYNPNIHPKAEYDRRLDSFIKFCEMKEQDDSHEEDARRNAHDSETEPRGKRVLVCQIVLVLEIRFFYQNVII